MRKQIAILICLALLASLCVGCGGRTASQEAPAIVAEAEPETAAEAEQSAEPAAEPEPEPEEPAPTEEPAGEKGKEPGHYVFQPKVCSVYLEEVFGETMCETWFNLVDAVMAGEDTFDCPDAHTYDWVMGQFPDKCFPVLGELIDYCYDRDHPVVNGKASFTYLVPREEAARRIAEFAALVEGILNETLEDDYSDLEKALALYRYFSENYVYDYEAARPDVCVDYLSSYRVLTTKTGICQEFSVAYAYLLMQAGVEATNMSGHRAYDHMGHQWTYVRINGHDFHIDPTYVIGSGNCLSYFMMDDSQREAEDGYYRWDYVITSNYAQDHPHPAYSASDDSFRALWGGYLTGFDHETHTLYYMGYDENWDLVPMSFDYTGW